MVPFHDDTPTDADDSSARAVCLHDSTPEPTMSDRVPLTTKQQAIYNYIRKHIEEKGFPPAIRDICTEFGISSPHGVSFAVVPRVKSGVYGPSHVPVRSRRHGSVPACCPNANAANPNQMNILMAAILGQSDAPVNVSHHSSTPR